MKISIGRRGVLLIALAAGLLVAGGVAYATIPAADNTYTACFQKSSGALRLIDPSLPAGPLSRCSSNEQQVTWNQQGGAGPKGATGATGARGPTGTAGATGSRGATGVRGPTGANGTNGTNGARGPTGPTGANGAGGGDADTLDGYDSTDFKVACGAGYAFSGGICWQVVDSCCFTLAEAANHCRLEQGRIPSYAELLAVAQSGLPLTGGLVLDWAADSVSDDNSIYINNGTPPNMDGERANTTSSYVRCVVLPVNALGTP